ncbi:outer membrane protein [Tabrizicola aquatica]|uniref:outer membrane protein n=1 Tax=Tabrizicola aquatica TaxID=909926 RepID=UPI000CD224BB|nr:outer membrane beta-barrel protein [Tabrizicola aquatica]
MMRKAMLCATVLTMAAGSVAAQDAGWAGYYGGVMGATHKGGQDYEGGSSSYDLEGPAFGIFAGHLWESGTLVYGAEVAAGRGGVYEVSEDGETSYKDDYEYNRFLDVKARAGYALNNVLLYGTIGLSRASFLSNETTTDSTGLILGVGADYKVNDRFFLGAEILRRNYDFYDNGQDVDIDASFNSLGLRAGIRF